MLSKKKDVHNYLIIFLFAHLIIWTFVPSITNQNLPLDTIEALAWSSNLDWGYGKHPPLSAFAVEIFYKIFKNNDWAYYLLSQIFVVFSFYIVFKFSEDFFKDKRISLISVFLLEGIYFYNFTTPEFNVNICQLPFWSLTVFYCWNGIKKNDYTSWLLLGLFASLGVLSKYLFIYLLISIDIFFIYLVLRKKINFKCLLSIVSFFVILLPHLIWLVKNDYVTFTYAFHRTGLDQSQLLDHMYNPVIFLVKQLGILIPLFFMVFLIIKKFKFRVNIKDKRLLFLLSINIIPIFLIFLTSLVTGAKIRTMWMTPFYLFIGVLILYILKEKIYFKKINYFFICFIFLFFLSPVTYSIISITQSEKRTDYPGKKISEIVQNKWNNNFKNKISLVAGDEWHGGNLSYNLSSRPKWDNIHENNKKIMLKSDLDGFVVIGNYDILSKICSGVFFKVENQGVCMVGIRK